MAECLHSNHEALNSNSSTSNTHTHKDDEIMDRMLKTIMERPHETPVEDSVY
jgi:hypothetical protein